MNKVKKMFKCEKYHGCGNDFIVCEYDSSINYTNLTPKVCNRYIGIGADTLITIDSKNKKISFYNADGTKAPQPGMTKILMFILPFAMLMFTIKILLVKSAAMMVSLAELQDFL